MAEFGESPKPTRRRVRRFVVCSLAVLLVVALWPQRGYRVDETVFVNSLGEPLLEVEGPSPSGKPARFNIHEYHSEKSALKRLKNMGMGLTPITYDGKEINTVMGIDPGLPTGEFTPELTIAFQFRTIYGFVTVGRGTLPQAKAQDEFARDCVVAIIGGIDKEVTGVTTYYNPPARQIWVKRVWPFLSKYLRVV